MQILSVVSLQGQSVPPGQMQRDQTGGGGEEGSDVKIIAAGT